MTVTETRNFAIKEILPTNAEGDREGCVFEDGKVTVPASFKKIFRLLVKVGGLQQLMIPMLAARGCPLLSQMPVLNIFVGQTALS